MRSESFYAENGIDLRLKAIVAGIDVGSRQVALSSGDKIAYDRLLLATGAEPVRLSIPGTDQPHVLTLRSLADCRAIIARARTARRAVVLGASFVGLEVAAALRARGLEVHVVAPEARPMERVLGAQLGHLVHALHVEHGVAFHLGDMAVAIDGRRLVLKSGGVIEADLVVAGVGVRPRIALAEKAGLALDRGVVVDGYLETNAPGVSQRATSPAGPIRTAETTFASSTGWWPSVRGRPPREICWARARSSPRCRSSGASTTRFRSVTSVTPKAGTSWRSRVSSLLGIASCVTSVRAGSWRLPRSIATSQVFRPK